MKLDYSLETPEERNELVKQILLDNDEPNSKYLEILADYLILCMEKQERKQKKILTENRMATVNKRETSFEGLISQFENGEDGIYNLITEDKNTIFQPKITITNKDIEEMPELRQLRDSIELWENKLKTAEGKEAYTIKKALIEMRKDQYLIKASYRRPLIATKLVRTRPQIKLDQVDLRDPKIVSIILCNYSHLKEDSYGKFEDDTWYLMYDFDELCGQALADFPLYERLVQYKIDGMQNVDIQQKLQEEFGIKHSLEYISSLWRNKIPKIIASAAEDNYLSWYYLEEEVVQYKKCNRCGQVKLAHNKYFSKNKSSKDGFYSICKECRCKKDKGEK